MRTLKTFKLVDLNDIFIEVFDMSITPFIDIVGFFDIVKFDEVLQVPNDMSTKEFVEQQYGKIGVLVIDLCLS